MFKMIVVLSSLFVLVLSLANVVSFEKVYGAGHGFIPQSSFNDILVQYERNCNFFTTNGERYCRFYKRPVEIPKINPTYIVPRDDINNIPSQFEKQCSNTPTGKLFCQFYRRSGKPSYKVSKKAIKDMARQFKSTCLITALSERVCHFDRIAN